MEYRIIGRHLGTGDEEQVDTFNNRAEARAMLKEYRLAFGAGWRLWISAKVAI